MPYGSNFPSLNFRTTGSWGVGNGLGTSGRLTNTQADENIDELGLAIEDLRDNPPAADGISNITSTSSSFTVHLASGTTFGPFALPVARLSFQGQWTAATAYQTNDIVVVTGDGVYLVLQNHTSAATFDSAAADSDGPIYHFMIGAGADGDDGSDGTNGTNGVDGATWFTGIGEPSASDGVDGDFYFDQGDSAGIGEGDVYEHQGSDGWVLIAALKGETGETGAQGPTGAGSTIIVEEGTVALGTAVANLNFDGDHFSVTQDSDGTANVSLAGSGWAFQETVATTSGTTKNIDVAGKSSVLLVFRGVSTSSSGRPIVQVSPDAGTTVRDGASAYVHSLLTNGTSSGGAGTSFIGAGNDLTTGSHYGNLEIYGLDVAQRSPFSVHRASTGSSLITGYVDIAEVVLTVVVTASAGSFDAGAIDVWAQ